MDIMDRDIDWSRSEDILEAAKPFDRSYNDKQQVVMLAGMEIVNFCRARMAPRQGHGRRSSDAETATKVQQLQAEIEQLQRDKLLLLAENDIFRHRLMKDRRQKDVQVEFDRRR